MNKIKKLLVANRSEIAIRIFRAATELGIRTVAVYAEEDKLSLHRFKADEAYCIGRGLGPLKAYLAIPEIINVARVANVDAIHPGYGFLSERPDFAEACSEAGIIFIGPSPQTMRTLGNKVSARQLAISVGVPVMPATGPLPKDDEEVRRFAEEIGYPVMLKASWGGGGRGMRPIIQPQMLLELVDQGRREARAAFGNDEVYLEKLVSRARHVEVQILGDHHGNLVHLFERDCTIQRRHQKIIERAPASFLSDETRERLTDAAVRIGRATSYQCAGTVEFLMDADTDRFYFIEVNPRIQVEHTVTEAVTGLDLVKAQIRIAEGGRLGNISETGIPTQEGVEIHGHALQCRITTENPENNFIPDYGRITAYRGSFGFGVRVDGGTAYSGAIVTRHYDAMLEKVTVWAPGAAEAVARMDRVVREYRIRGVATNLTFLESVLNHPNFISANYTTRFIDETPELFVAAGRRDRATKLLTYIADVTVNGHPETRGRPRPAVLGIEPRLNPNVEPVRDGRRQLLQNLGPKRFGEWMRNHRRPLITDTTMRDAHQSLLATRIRTYDIVSTASAYARELPELLSLECWGGATFDVSMRFLQEDPWERLAIIRQNAPNMLLQALVRGANGVGYGTYADNVVTFFIKTAADAGIDIFRIFDCLNWVANMRSSIDAVCEAGKIAEGAFCYTGDLLDPDRSKYTLKYYVDLAKDLERAGCHIIGIKDMAGILKPMAARSLVGALKSEVGLPIHLHTHDTSGGASATIIAAVEAGVDAFDAAMDSFSGGTSQPALGTLVAGLRRTEFDTGIGQAQIRPVNEKWRSIRENYRAFESDMRGLGAEVYEHEMPGGQYTNLLEQAKSMGLGHRWTEITKAYRDANRIFGDIVKVTPSSKVVGDMALAMVSQGLTDSDIVDPAIPVAFPASVVSMLRGELGQPPGGWPQDLQLKALNGQKPITVPPSSLLEPVELESVRQQAGAEFGTSVDDRTLSSYLMYPKVFADYWKSQNKYGPVSVLPTPVFFYGMTPGQEISVDLERGKALVIRLQAISETDDEGNAKAFFDLNGQPRIIAVPDRSKSNKGIVRRTAEDGNPSHVAAPMPGIISTVMIVPDQEIKKGDVLLAIEAMKMETAVYAGQGGRVKELLIRVGQTVDAKDLLAIIG